MTRMIQIRNVPEALHRKLKVRAAAAGMSLSDYLLLQLEEIGAMATHEEMLERLNRLPPCEVSRPPAEVLHEERERR